MALSPLVLQIGASVDSSLPSALESIFGSSKKMAGALGEAQQKAEDLRKEIKRARDAGDTAALMTAQAQLANHLSSAAGQAMALGQQLTVVRDRAAAVGAAGAAGLALANSFIKASQEATELDVRLQSILKTQGRLQDKGKIEGAVTKTVETGHFNVEERMRWR